jgi:hypothetical protein
MRDTARTLVRASAAAMPVIGGPLAVVIEEVWQPRWLRQGREFVEQLADDVEAMGAELYASVDELREALEQPEVSEVFHRAGQIASVSSQAATRRRCRAAVLNAMRQSQNAAYNLRFVRLIDELAPAHFTLLALLEGPAGNTEFASQVENTMGGSMSRPVAEVLGYDEGFVQMLSADLFTARAWRGSRRDDVSAGAALEEDHGAWRPPPRICTASCRGRRH